MPLSLSCGADRIGTGPPQIVDALDQLRELGIVTSIILIMSQGVDPLPTPPYRPDLVGEDD